MSIHVVYTLRVTVPDFRAIDADTLREIQDDAEPHDRDWSQKVMRWLGGPMRDAERELSAALPEGWYATIESEYARV